MELSSLRVLQIGAAYVGAQKQIEDAIYSGLCEHGAANKVLYWVGESDNEDYVRCERKVENIFRRFCYKYIQKSHIFSRLQTRRAIKYIDSFKPNIVHLHSIHHGYIDYPLLFDYLRAKGIKIIYTVHDMWPFTGGCYHYTNLGCTGFMNECSNCPNNKEHHDCELSMTPKSFVIKKACFEGQNITFVAVSNWVKEEMMKSFLKDYPCYVIKNCVNIDNKSSLSETTLSQDIILSIQNKKTIVFVAAAWDERKGYSFICELADLLGDDYRLIVVGSISDNLKSKARPNMLFTGYMKERGNLQYLYKVCNLHASASREETFGMTFVEAAIEGTRSIGFASTAVQDTISSVGGVCVNSFDVKTYYDAIIKHIDDPKLGSDDVLKIRELFSKETLASGYIDVYRRC